MAGALVHRDTPMEYFRGLVEYAVERRRVKPSVHTRFYLVHLLAGFVSTADPADGALGGEALGVRLARALQAGGAARRESLRQVGDASLFISGFFAESLSRRLVDVDYYIALGGRAYGSLGRAEDEASAGVFAELAGRFVDFVDLLGEVSDQTAKHAGNTDLLRLYEKWLRTGSRRDGDRLAARGLIPGASTTSRVQ